MNADLVSRFLSYLRTERGMSDNTLAAYEADLSRFAASQSASMAQVKRTDLQKYIGDALTTGRSGKTTARYLACLRCFYRFLVDEGEIEHDPTRNLPVPKVWKRLPHALSEADLETVLSSLGTRLIDTRDAAMLLLFFAAGLRVSDITNLKVQDVNLQDGVLKVWNGKGGKDGVLPVNGRAVEAVRAYLHGRPASGPYLFPGRHGKQLTRQAIHRRVRKLGKAVLHKNIFPHQLRHGFATALVEGGADIRDVQVLMRHSDVETTRIYVHMDLTFLRRTYNASHPRASLPASQN